MMIAVLDEPELVSVTEEKIIPLNPFINESRNKNKNKPVGVLAEFVAGVAGIVYMLAGHLVVELVAKILVFVVAAVFAVEVVFGHY